MFALARTQDGQFSHDYLYRTKSASNRAKASLSPSLQAKDDREAPFQNVQPQLNPVGYLIAFSLRRLFRILATINPVVPPPNPGQYSVKHVESFTQLLHHVAARDLNVFEFARSRLKADLELFHPDGRLRYVNLLDELIDPVHGLRLPR